MTFAEQLKLIRGQKGMTQEQLAEAAELSIGTLREYEQGKRRLDPTFSTVVRLARALNVSVEAFSDSVSEVPAIEPISRGRPSAEKPASKRGPGRPKKSSG